MADGAAETKALVVDIILIVFDNIFDVIVIVNAVFSILTGVPRKGSVTAFIAAVCREFGGATTLHGRVGERETRGDKEVLHATMTNRQYHCRTTLQV